MNNSQFGGSWSGGQAHFFASDGEAFMAGAGYIESHQAWASTEYGSFDGSVAAFKYIKENGVIPSRSEIAGILKFTQERLPSAAELARRFGSSFEDYVNSTLLRQFEDIGARALSDREKLNAVMGAILYEDFQSLLKDADNLHYLTLVEVRMKLVDTSTYPARTLDELKHTEVDYPARIFNPPGSLTPGVVFNPGMGVIEIPVNSSQDIWVLMEFNYLFNY